MPLGEYWPMPTTTAGACVHGVPWSTTRCWQCCPATVQDLMPPLQAGWQCPVCWRVMAPAMVCCLFCVPSAGSAVTTGTTSAEPAWNTPLPPPALMDPGLTQGVSLGGEWTELLPGLQARIFSPADPLRVTAQFRRTPEAADES